MAIYKFRVSFEDFDDVVREIDIKSNQTFEDLHKAIHRSTGYNVDKPSSFFVSTDNWIKGDEIAYQPTQRKIDRGVVLMENSKLSNFIEDPHQKFYYTYNFDRPFDFHVELVKIILDADPNIEYPFLAKSVGEAPKIFDRTNLDAIPVVSSSTPASEFDFLNDLDFVPEDTESLEAMGDMGINEKESEESNEEEDDEFSDEFSDDENYEGDDNNKDDY